MSRIKDIEDLDEEANSSLADDNKLIVLDAKVNKKETSKLSVDLVVSELMANYGNKTAIAKKLGVPPIELRRFIDANPEIQEHYQLAKERIVDVAEGVLLEALMPKKESGRLPDLKAAMFVLERLGSYTKPEKGSATNIQINNSNALNTDRKMLIIDGEEIEI